MTRKRGGKVTSVDVARHVGVSQSAVSRAFAPGPKHRGVSPETRARILAAADELGYRPNAMARSLVGQRSRIIAVLFSYLDNPFYALALEKLCLALQEQGYHALVLMMPDTIEGTERTVSDLLGYQVDGIITASVELSSRLCQYCRDEGIPVVMFNRVQDDPTLSSVTTDNVTGGRLAARKLIEDGNRRIALLAGWERASTNRDREFGFKAELAAQDMPLHARVVGHFHLGHTREAVAELMAAPVPPDAVFVANDYMALEALSALRHRHGVRVPEDIAVIGFDDVPRAALPEFDLTTVRQPLDRMVENAVRVLVTSLETPGQEAEHLALVPRLIVRRSTRNPAR
ncbi:MAG: LacI family DNA-binding transcriptional regulator [Pseudomonadota bacterium]